MIDDGHFNYQINCLRRFMKVGKQAEIYIENIDNPLDNTIFYTDEQSISGLVGDNPTEITLGNDDTTYTLISLEKASEQDYYTWYHMKVKRVP